MSSSKYRGECGHCGYVAHSIETLTSHILEHENQLDTSEFQDYESNQGDSENEESELLPDPDPEVEHEWREMEVSGDPEPGFDREMFDPSEEHHMGTCDMDGDYYRELYEFDENPQESSQETYFPDPQSPIRENDKEVEDDNNLKSLEEIAHGDVNTEKSFKRPLFFCAHCDYQSENLTDVQQHTMDSHKLNSPLDFQDENEDDANHEEGDDTPWVLEKDEEYENSDHVNDNVALLANDTANLDSKNPDSKEAMNNQDDKNNDKSEIISTNEKELFVSKFFKCAFKKCSVIFSTKRDLIRHIKSFHLKNGGRLFYCTYCNFAATNQESVRRHTTYVHIEKAKLFNSDLTKGQKGLLFIEEKCGRGKAGPFYYRCLYCNFRCNKTKTTILHTFNQHQGLWMKYLEGHHPGFANLTEKVGILKALKQLEVTTLNNNDSKKAQNSDGQKINERKQPTMSNLENSDHTLIIQKPQQTGTGKQKKLNKHLKPTFWDRKIREKRNKKGVNYAVLCKFGCPGGLYCPGCRFCDKLAGYATTTVKRKPHKNNLKYVEKLYPENSSDPTKTILFAEEMEKIHEDVDKVPRKYAKKKQCSKRRPDSEKQYNKVSQSEENNVDQPHFDWTEFENEDNFTDNIIHVFPDKTIQDVHPNIFSCTISESQYLTQDFDIKTEAKEQVEENETESQRKIVASSEDVLTTVGTCYNNEEINENTTDLNVPEKHTQDFTNYSSKSPSENTEKVAATDWQIQIQGQIKIVASSEDVQTTVGTCYDNKKINENTTEFNVPEKVTKQIQGQMEIVASSEDMLTTVGTCSNNKEINENTTEFNVPEKDTHVFTNHSSETPSETIETVGDTNLGNNNSSSLCDVLFNFGEFQHGNSLSDDDIRSFLQNDGRDVFMEKNQQHEQDNTSQTFPKQEPEDEGNAQLEDKLQHKEGNNQKQVELEKGQNQHQQVQEEDFQQQQQQQQQHNNDIRSFLHNDGRNLFFEEDQQHGQRNTSQIFPKQEPEDEGNNEQQVELEIQQNQHQRVQAEDYQQLQIQQELPLDEGMLDAYLRLEQMMDLNNFQSQSQEIDAVNETDQSENATLKQLMSREPLVIEPLPDLDTPQSLPSAPVPHYKSILPPNTPSSNAKKDKSRPSVISRSSFRYGKLPSSLQNLPECQRGCKRHQIIMIDDVNKTGVSKYIVVHDKNGSYSLPSKSKIVLNQTEHQPGGRLSIDSFNNLEDGQFTVSRYSVDEPSIRSPDIRSWINLLLEKNTSQFTDSCHNLDKEKQNDKSCSSRKEKNIPTQKKPSLLVSDLCHNLVKEKQNDKSCSSRKEKNIPTQKKRSLLVSDKKSKELRDILEYHNYCKASPPKDVIKINDSSDTESATSTTSLMEERNDTPSTLVKDGKAKHVERVSIEITNDKNVKTVIEIPKRKKEFLKGKNSNYWKGRKRRKARLTCRKRKYSSKIVSPNEDITCTENKDNSSYFENNSSFCENDFDMPCVDTVEENNFLYDDFDEENTNLNRNEGLNVDHLFADFRPLADSVSIFASPPRSKRKYEGPIRVSKRERRTTFKCLCEECCIMRQSQQDIPPHLLGKKVDTSKDPKLKMKPCVILPDIGLLLKKYFI